RALAARVAFLRETYRGDVLVEAYLPGPEYNVGLVALPDPEPLPIAEVVYAPEAGAWPILSHAAEWDLGAAGGPASPVRGPGAGGRGRPGRVAGGGRGVVGGRAGPSGGRRLPGDGVPRLCEGRPAARRPRRADDPGGEPEPRHRPIGRLGTGRAGVGEGLRRD